ncbi:MAG: 2-oxo acid dehydrogenase subunit E2 [Thermoflexus sp.]|uniref:dihydrolipoamide acetyltransferase family protein n=1 Tax=Thermoflexus sp. TaxID=1969742 RepID=UPI0025EADD43|nr:dihydrolipoamide acetyltransferase family protein [Thermoflexus sp.]MCS6964717.1 2-oxo acid dehydrogenase subunit E2 [Thermoflexus sp.]MDW8184405.1 dihydrolipoamide acetyltransferase family protein [Anaerolineae bacterium]
MPVPVIMPKFEMAQESGKVLRWLKQEGDAVAKGEAILEVETDKVAMEVEAPASGTLVGIRVGPGEVVPIGQPIAFILLPGEVWTAAPTPSPAPSPGTPRATPLAERLAQAHGVDLAAVLGTGPGGRVTKADVEMYLARQRMEEAPKGAVRAVPAARRLARELGVDLREVKGTGPGGRIQSADVLRAAEAIPRAAEAEALPRPALRRRVPLTGMRRAIAERMLRSVREAPQFTVSVDVEMGRTLAMVEDLSAWAEREEGVRVTLTALLIRACAWALRRHPSLNATLEGEEILEWEEVNIGVAVAVPEGLVVPVVPGADRKGLIEIARALEEKATRAREGRLRPEDLQGGTFTLSNLGMYGVDRFTAILNPPQAAILAVGRVAKRPVVEEGDRVEVRSMATFTLTADHRIVDGVQAARFLDDLRMALERPGILLG